jgi:ketosteroid isomerase-like protein
MSVEPERLVDSGDQVVAVVRSRLQPKGSSGEIELRTGFLWTFHDGKVASLRLFAKPEEALEAAGLSE